jgi:hypothetical protein
MPYVRSDANLALSRANWRALSLWFVFRGVRAAALEQRHDVYRRSASLEEHYEQPSLEARKREELARRATRWDEKCRDADTLEAAMWRAYHEYQAYRRAAFNECKRNMLIWLMWHQLVTVADHGCYRGIPDAKRLSTTHHHKHHTLPGILEILKKDEHLSILHRNHQATRRAPRPPPRAPMSHPNTPHSGARRARRGGQKETRRTTTS